MAKGVEDRAGADDGAFVDDAQGAEAGRRIDLSPGGHDRGWMAASGRLRPKPGFEHGAHQGQSVGGLVDPKEDLAGNGCAREISRHKNHPGPGGGDLGGVLGITQER